MLKWRRQLQLGLGLLLAGLIALAPMAAWASTYGSGSYGQCAYSTGCATTSNPTTPTTTTPGATQPEIILLNDFPQYYTAAGIDLQLNEGQVVYFDVTQNGQTVRHSITIKTVGPDYVDIVIDSTDYHLTTGQSNGYDVNGDNQNDIQIGLKSITGNQALLNFRALGGNVNPTQPTTTPAAKTPVGHPWWWWLLLIIFVLLIIIGLWWFIILWKRRRRDDDDKNVTTNSGPGPPAATPPGN